MAHVIALSIALILNAAANLLMKVGMNQVRESGGILSSGAVGAIKTVLTSPALMIGLTCFGLNAACYMFALQSKTLKISLAYPLMVGGGYAIISIVAWLALKERLNAGQWMGVALILAGVIVIATQTRVEGS